MRDFFTKRVATRFDVYLLYTFGFLFGTLKGWYLIGSFIAFVVLLVLSNYLAE